MSPTRALLDESQRRELGLPAAGQGDDTGSTTCDLHTDPERKDSSNYGSCKLFVGVAYEAVVAVIDVKIDTSADGSDCDRADRAASMVLATLK